MVHPTRSTTVTRAPQSVWDRPLVISSPLDPGGLRPFLRLRGAGAAGHQPRQAEQQRSGMHAAPRCCSAAVRSYAAVGATSGSALHATAYAQLALRPHLQIAARPGGADLDSNIYTIAYNTVNNASTRRESNPRPRHSRAARPAQRAGSSRTFGRWLPPPPSGGCVV